jgi:hypothetical protein
VQNAPGAAAAVGADLKRGRFEALSPLVAMFALCTTVLIEGQGRYLRGVYAPPVYEYDSLSIKAVYSFGTLVTLLRLLPL